MKDILCLEIFKTFLGDYLVSFLGDFFGIIVAKPTKKKVKIAAQRFLVARRDNDFSFICAGEMRRRSPCFTRQKLTNENHRVS